MPDARVATIDEQTPPDDPGSLEHVVRDFIVKTFVFDDEVAGGLTDSSDLVELGLLDSMNVLQLVDFIEVEFDFLLDPEDLFLLTSIEGIVKIIRDRTAS